jgi:hypothetical protein
LDRTGGARAKAEDRKRILIWDTRQLADCRFADLCACFRHSNERSAPMNIRAQIHGHTPSAESPLVLVKQPKGATAEMLHSIPVARREARWADTRAEERSATDALPASLTHRGATYDVQLMNRCSGGAMVAANFGAMPWDSAQLYLKEQGIVECAVLWLKNGFMGLRFAEEGATSVAWQDSWMRMSLNEPGDDLDRSPGH